MKLIGYIALFTILLTGCREDKSPVANNNNTTFELLTPFAEVVAGNAITIKFKTSVVEDVYLLLNNATGSTLVSPIVEGETLSFSFPSSFKEKAGICSWYLVYNGTTQEDGQLNILPNSENPILETYLGPRSISAGNQDFSMLVIAPTDSYDNPLLDSTRINYSHQFKSVIQKKFVHTRNLIGWERIYSPKESGQILVASSFKNVYSKEFVTKVYPSNPTDFNIYYKRNHRFADGNQQIEFITDIIKDEFGNVVTDGTMVTFTIKSSENMILQTVGTTLNGIAKGKILHPNKEQSWDVTAYVVGAAESNKLVVDFEEAIENFDIEISIDRTTVYVSNMNSFMQQLVPDGIPITMVISKPDGELVERKTTTTRLGKGTFKLTKDFLEKGSYQIKIESAGITKTENLEIK